MKYLIILLIFISCDGWTPPPEREYIEEVCPTCHGLRVVDMSTSEKVGLGLVTFGLGLMCDKTDCETCNGTGIVRIPVPNSN